MNRHRHDLTLVTHHLVVKDGAEVQNLIVMIEILLSHHLSSQGRLYSMLNGDKAQGHSKCCKTYELMVNIPYVEPLAYPVFVERLLRQLLGIFLTFLLLSWDGVASERVLPYLNDSPSWNVALWT